MATPVYQFTIKEEVNNFFGSEFLVYRTNKEGVKEFISGHHSYEAALEEVCLATPLTPVITE